MLRESLSKFFKVDSLISNLTGYIETRIELLKVEAKEELSKGLSNVLIFLLLAFVFAVFLILLSVAVALEIGSHIGNIWGFTIVSFVYLVAGMALLLSREKLTKSLEKKITAAFNKKKK